MSELARKKRAADASEAMAQYLVFEVSGAQLGVALVHVSEIVAGDQVTQLPGTPAHVRGVAHVRGRMVPVMDAAARLGLPRTAATKRSCIVMLERPGEAQYGLMVDRVATLLEVELSRVQRAPDFGAGVDVRYIEGLYYSDERVLPLLSSESLFSGDDLRAAYSVIPGGAS